MEFMHGTGVAVVTPFNRTGNVDFPSLKKIIDHLIDGGVEYLVALGTTGESATLTADEQAKVIETFIEHNAGRVPMVLGAGGNNTVAVVEKVKQFTEKYQPAAILSVSPYYNKPTAKGLLAHYKAVAGATDVPVILYNVPGRTASNIPAEVTLELAHEVPNIVAVKEASGSLDQCMTIVREKPEDFLLVSGDDGLTLPMMSIGGVGVISVIGNALPRPFTDMVRAALANEWEKARELHYQLFPLMNLNFAEGNPAGVKQLMALQGICEKGVRLPLVEASQDLAEQMQLEFEKLPGAFGIK